MHNTRRQARAIAIARTMDERKQFALRLFVVAGGAISALSLLAISALL